MEHVKLDALVHYICARCDDPSKLGATKLNKVLWFSDSGAFLLLGRPITDAVYIKRQFGPVPRDILASRARLVESGAIVERETLHFGFQQKQMIALREPDLSFFTAQEISIVDRVLNAICNGHTASSISELSHNDVWQVAEIGEELPMFTVMSVLDGEVDEEDISWGHSLMSRLEPNRVSA